ncbi:hypothetical protein SDJN03_15754, partial [Cucurbita argyrosperma subsp. sororia]
MEGRTSRDSDTSARTASVEKAARKGKQRTPIANRGHDAGVAGKSSDANASSLLASKSLSHSSSQGKRSIKKQENDIRRTKVSYERRKTRGGGGGGGEDLYVESVRKTHSKNTKDLSNTMDSTVKKSRGITPSDPTKKRVFRTTSANGDLEIRTDKSKKRKRFPTDPIDCLDVIELLYFSIAELNDRCIVLPLLPENARQEKAKPEEKDEISSNAQFRAIQPSKSIISFVEDNVICIAMCC